MPAFAPRLIDVADFFIDLGEISELIRKDTTQPGDYDVPSFVPDDMHVTGSGLRSNGRDANRSIQPSRAQQEEDEADLLRIKESR